MLASLATVTLIIVGQTMTFEKRIIENIGLATLYLLV